MIKWLLRLLKPRVIYRYGYIVIGGVKYRRVRLNTRTGDVEFILWEAGQHGHKEDFWYRMGDGWVTKFVADEDE